MDINRVTENWSPESVGRRVWTSSAPRELALQWRLGATRRRELNCRGVVQQLYRVRACQHVAPWIRGFTGPINVSGEVSGNGCVNTEDERLIVASFGQAVPPASAALA